MPTPYIADKNRSRKAALTLTLLAHLLAGYWFLHPDRQAVRYTPDEHAIYLHYIPAQRVAEKLPVPPRTERGSPRTEVKRPKVVPDTTSHAEEQTAEEERPLPTPAEVSSTMPGNIIANARRDIGAIDRELRKGRPNLPPPTPHSIQLTLEKGIAAAGKSRVPAIETIILADGRKMDKITTMNGTYCVTTDSLATSHGRDLISQGIRIVAVRCP